MISFVTNMYPDEDKKYYGIFVKNYMKTLKLTMIKHIYMY